MRLQQLFKGISPLTVVPRVENFLENESGKILCNKKESLQLGKLILEECGGHRHENLIALFELASRVMSGQGAKQLMADPFVRTLKTTLESLLKAKSIPRRDRLFEELFQLISMLAANPKGQVNAGRLLAQDLWKYYNGLAKSKSPSGARKVPGFIIGCIVELIAGCPSNRAILVKAMGASPLTMVVDQMRSAPEFHEQMQLAQLFVRLSRKQPAKAAQRAFGSSELFAAFSAIETKPYESYIGGVVSLLEKLNSSLGPERKIYSIQSSKSALGSLSFHSTSVFFGEGTCVLLLHPEGSNCSKRFYEPAPFFVTLCYSDLERVESSLSQIVLATKEPLHDLNDNLRTPLADSDIVDVKIGLQQRDLVGVPIHTKLLPRVKAANPHCRLKAARKASRAVMPQLELESVDASASRPRPTEAHTITIAGSSSDGEAPPSSSSVRAASRKRPRDRPWDAFTVTADTVSPQSSRVPETPPPSLEAPVQNSSKRRRSKSKSDDRGKRSSRDTRNAMRATNVGDATPKDPPSRTPRKSCERRASPGGQPPSGKTPAASKRQDRSKRALFPAEDEQRNQGTPRTVKKRRPATRRADSLALDPPPQLEQIAWDIPSLSFDSKAGKPGRGVGRPLDKCEDGVLDALRATKLNHDIVLELPKRLSKPVAPIAIPFASQSADGDIRTMVDTLRGTVEEKIALNNSALLSAQRDSNTEILRVSSEVAESVETARAELVETAERFNQQVRDHIEDIVGQVQEDQARFVESMRAADANFNATRKAITDHSATMLAQGKELDAWIDGGMQSLADFSQAEYDKMKKFQDQVYEDNANLRAFSSKLHDAFGLMEDVMEE